MFNLDKNPILLTLSDRNGWERNISNVNQELFYSERKKDFQLKQITCNDLSGEHWIILSTGRMLICFPLMTQHETKDSSHALFSAYTHAKS